MTDRPIARPKVRFLTCLWGGEHRRRWLALSLPSLLAAGNLPALAACTDLEFVVLTDKRSVSHIRSHAAFRRLQALCEVRFISIDDLIVGTTYGVTLTLAYARGIVDAGTEQTSTVFVFMNSDFILADGSLATLAKKILEGHRCIVAPSLRATAEPLLPELRKSVARNILSLKARKLVAMALSSLHPTTLGKIIGHNAFHCISFNQTYWWLNKTSLLGRYHLLFMLCIRPERPLGPVNSYCDYGFIPELVPTSPLIPLTDSDEFFMLELGHEYQEADLIRPGPADLRRLANGLRKWTTKEHRRSAEFDFIFHSGPLPQNLGRASKRAASFVAELHARMGNRPASHVNHHYWIRGLQHWLRAKISGRTAQFPPELAGGRLAKWLARYVYLIAWIRGVPPRVPMRAYDWSEYQLMRQWYSSLGEMPDKSVLLICPEESRMRDWLAGESKFDTLPVWNNHISIPANQKRYRNILLHADAAFLRKPDQVLKPLLTHLTRGGEIAVFIGSQRRSTAAPNLNPYLNMFMHRSTWRYSNALNWEVQSVHGFIQRQLGALLFRITDTSFDDFFKTRPRWSPAGILASLALLPAISVLNACSFDRLARRVSRYRSAAFLRCRRVDPTTSYDIGD